MFELLRARKKNHSCFRLTQHLPIVFLKATAKYKRKQFFNTNFYDAKDEKSFQAWKWLLQAKKFKFKYFFPSKNYSREIYDGKR